MTITRADYLRFFVEETPRPTTLQEREALIQALVTVAVTTAHVHSGAEYCNLEQIETVVNVVLHLLWNEFGIKVGDA